MNMELTARQRCLGFGTSCYKPLKYAVLLANMATKIDQCHVQFLSLITISSWKLLEGDLRTVHIYKCIHVCVTHILHLFLG